MRNQTNQKPGRLEQEKQDIVRRGSKQISDELKDAVDLAYKLSIKKPPYISVETLTNGSSNKP